MRKRSVTGVVAGLGMVGLGVFLLATSIPAGGERSPVTETDYLTADLWNDGRLVEKLRSAYWEEDVYSRLERVKERP